MKIQEHNAETNNTVIRNANKSEVDNAEAVQLEIDNLRETQTAAKAAVLERLGITADEAALLLG
jgi:hypothetical protein